MTEAKAKRIQLLRAGPIQHSLRRIAEIIEAEYPEYPELSGNQLYGSELVMEAMEFIYGKPINEISDEIRRKWDR